jgi:hypothetical protein
MIHGRVSFADFLTIAISLLINYIIKNARVRLPHLENDSYSESLFLGTLSHETS